MRNITSPCARYALGVVAVALSTFPCELRGQQAATISGRLTVMEQDDEFAQDVATAVVWLEARRAAASALAPDTVDVITANKQFRPSVVVVPIGSTLRFPNSDPFDHNVFSTTREAPFDLGHYGRGESRQTTFNRPGIITIYCNVHPAMAASIVVRDNRHYAQPAGDGSFVLRDVPVGSYTLHAWHVRAPAYAVEIDVSAGDINVIDIHLDASRYRVAGHRNKYGRPYSRRGRRY